MKHAQVGKHLLSATRPDRVLPFDRCSSMVGSHICTNFDVSLLIPISPCCRLYVEQPRSRTREARTYHLRAPYRKTKRPPETASKLVC